MRDTHQGYLGAGNDVTEELVEGLANLLSVQTNGRRFLGHAVGDGQILFCVILLLTVSVEALLRLRNVVISKNIINISVIWIPK